jgi:hypothetical protein
MSEKVLGLKRQRHRSRIPRKTIGKYDLGFNGKDFMLLNKRPPACRGSMWNPQEKQKTNYLKFPVKQTVNSRWRLLLTKNFAND